MFCISRVSIKGFTLIELIVVITIVAILASLGTFNYLHYLKVYYRSQAKVALLSKSKSLADIYLVNHKYISINNPIMDFYLPDKGNARYYIQVKIGKSGQSFALIANPKGKQSGDGALFLDQEGQSRHYDQDSALGTFVDW